MILTETQYRQMSGDTRSPWTATGGVAGVATLIPIVEEQVGEYLGTFLEPTSVSGEEHYIDIQQKFFMGQVVRTRALVDTFRCRLVPGATITVTFYPLLSGGSSSSSTDVMIVGTKLGRIDIARTLVGRSFSYYRDDYITLSYRAGYWSSIPYNVRWGVALLAREAARELIVKSGRVMDDDYPHFAPVRVMSEMGTSRSFEQRESQSFFGDSPTAKYVESILAAHQVKKAQGIR